MASRCELVVDHDGDAGFALAVARDEVLRIEAKYSRYRDDSVVSAINRAAGGAGVAVDDETAALLDLAAAAHAASDGRFDATSGVLRRAWDFGAARVATTEALAALLPLVGWQQVEWNRPHLRLPRAGMELDFGGFGKEYAADRAAAVLASHGIAHGFVVLGDTPARMLLLCSPGGFEQFVLELSEPAPAPPDMAKLMAVAAAHQIDIHGPLPALPDSLRA